MVRMSTTPSKDTIKRSLARHLRIPGYKDPLSRCGAHTPHKNKQRDDLHHEKETGQKVQFLKRL